jgi:catechol 2,3-dioxygenase
MTTEPEHATAPVLPATLRLGPVHVTVRDLDRAVEWYGRALGLAVLSRDGDVAELGDDFTPSVILHADPLARPAGRHSGLYHYALLYPSREELARAAVRLASTRTPIQGASDHGTHEAIYLPDADGNGIELAADRPQEVWPSFEEEFARGGPAPLDVDDLLSTVQGQSPRERVGEGLRVGHVHLHVGNVERGLAFYRDLLGFELKASLGSAAFVSAGGYHHHLGFNVWHGEGAPPVPEHVAGLHHWTIALDDAAEVAEVRARVDAAGVPVEDATDSGFTVRDPWDIPVRIEAAR